MQSVALPNLEVKLRRGAIEFHVEQYHALGLPKLAVVMLHGFSAHCGLYRHVGAAFATRGIATTLFDCRGHGRSLGRRGHVEEFSDYLNDLAIVTGWARKQTPNVPWTLLGHSMGGTVAAAFAMTTEPSHLPDRLVLAAPWLKLEMKVPTPQYLASNVAARLLPTLTGPNGLKAENVSRNPQVIAKFNEDPLVHHVATAGWFMAMLRAQAQIRAQASKLAVPTLLLIAGQDRIVSNEANLAFAQAAGSRVTIRRYPPLFHEMLLEPEAADVVSDIADWLTCET